MRSGTRWATEFGVWLLLMLAALEIVLRIGLASPRHQHAGGEFGSVREPNRRVVQSREGYSVSHTNSRGWFDEEERPATARLHAVLYGDSYSEALQVPRQSRFATLLEQRIEDFDVLNVSLSGAAPPNHVLLARAIEPRPDIAIVQLSDDDPSRLFAPEWGMHLVATGEGDWSIESPQVSTAFSFAQRTLRPLTSHSAIANVGVRKLRVIVEGALERWIGKARPPTGAPDAPDEPASETVDAALAWTLTKVAATASNTLVLYIPTIDYFTPGCPVTHPVARETIARATARAGLTLVDPTDAFCRVFHRTGRMAHGFDNGLLVDAHLNETGHRIVADELAGALREVESQ